MTASTKLHDFGFLLLLFNQSTNQKKADRKCSDPMLTKTEIKRNVEIFLLRTAVYRHLHKKQKIISTM
jgi:hypothetical protein